MSKPKLPLSVQFRKHWWFFVSAIGLLAIMGGLTATYRDAIFATTTDDYARYSFTMTALIAVSLAIYFWYLQKQDNETIEALSRDIHRHINLQAQIQDSIRINSFNSIKVSLTHAVATIEHITQEIVKKQSQSNDVIATAEYLDHLLVIYHSLRPPIESILQQLVILRPYIRGEFASKIESVAETIMYTGLASKDESAGGRIFAVEAPDTVMQWLNFAKETINKIAQLDKEIEDYRP